LELEKSFPDAKVVLGNEITMSGEVVQEIGPFMVNKAEINAELLSQIRNFWLSLSSETREEVTNNKFPSNSPILIDGYASTTGRTPENFNLANRRANEVLKILMMLSGNRDDKTIFKTTSFGEFTSPEATDIKSEEKESEKYRKVIITLSYSKTVKIDDQGNIIH
jgi:outer membrane protein OmpA-like peptidoglycan-associated protein